MNTNNTAIRDLSDRIKLIGTHCGDCDKWMKSSACPREINIKGRLFGPSCNSPICDEFVECSTATNNRAKLTADLAKLNNT